MLVSARVPAYGQNSFVVGIYLRRKFNVEAKGVGI